MKRRILDHLRDSKTISKKDRLKILGASASPHMDELWGIV